MGSAPVQALTKYLIASTFRSLERPEYLKEFKLMANLKLDLLNKLRNDKYYKELKLVRLAQDPVMDYEEKIELMNEVLGLIVELNNKMVLAEEYFKEPEQPQQPVAAPPVQPPAPAPVDTKPAAKVHPGQSHGEG